jgi:hypothetical protein
VPVAAGARDELGAASLRLALEISPAARESILFCLLRSDGAQHSADLSLALLRCSTVTTLAILFNLQRRTIAHEYTPSTG